MTRKNLLTTQEMAAARLLLDRTKTHDEVALQAGMNVRTMQRRMKTAQFIAYQDELRAQDAKEIKAKTENALKKINFNKGDAVEVLATIARSHENGSKARSADQIKAIEVLANLLGWAPNAGEIPGPDAPEKPDVYQAEWMRKPQ